ncbi:MAG: hypothetical protein AB7O96_11460 [Pseudobdellovibrionaceae bacterium]
MKFLRSIAGCLIVSFISQAVYAECDEVRLEQKVRETRLKMEEDLKTILQENENYVPNLAPFAKQVEDMNKCRFSKNLRVYSCRSFMVFGIADIGSEMNFEKIFDMSDASDLKCRPETKFATMIRSRVTGEQIVTTFDGMHALNNEPVCQSKDGKEMGRTFVFTDSRSSQGKSSFFVLDLGIPLDDYLTSQFWGVDYLVGNKKEKVIRDVVDGNLRLRFTNGAEVQIHPVKRMIVSTNFLTEASYDYSCTTDHDGGTGKKRKYWPVTARTEEGKKYLGKPSIVEGFVSSKDHFNVQDFVLKTLADEI